MKKVIFILCVMFALVSCSNEPSVDTTTATTDSTTVDSTVVVDTLATSVDTTAVDSAK